MAQIIPISLKRMMRWPRAVVPLALALMIPVTLAVATARPDIDRQAQAVRLATGGDLGPDGFFAIHADMDPSQLALAIRHDPRYRQAALYGLTPGWETLSLGGKPTLDFGQSGLEAQRINAATPSSGLLRPARPFVFRPASEADRRRALRCLTQGIYYEAALEPTEGQEAVAQVILNRVRDLNYPNSICGVVFEGADRTTGCQFSFTCMGALAQAPVGWAWKRSQLVAERMLAGHVATKVGTATHYHADYVHPWWATTLNKLTQIGAHIFYRWKGLSGETAAFRQAYSGREPVIDEARLSRPRLQIAATDGASIADAVANGEGMAPRTVVIDGQTRVVGVVSLGGRRQPTPEEIAAINQRLAEYEQPAVPEPATPPPAGVTVMPVEEVGRPTR